MIAELILLDDASLPQFKPIVNIIKDEKTATASALRILLDQESTT